MYHNCHQSEGEMEYVLDLCKGIQFTARQFSATGIFDRTNFQTLEGAFAGGILARPHGSISTVLGNLD